MGRAKVIRYTPLADVELLRAIIKYRGGAATLTKLLKCSPQNIRNWAHTGRVPLKNVVIYGRLLDVNPYALNYKQYYKMMETGPEFKKLVQTVSFLPPDVIDKILSKKEPKV